MRNATQINLGEAAISTVDVQMSNDTEYSHQHYGSFKVPHVLSGNAVVQKTAISQDVGAVSANKHPIVQRDWKVPPKRRGGRVGPLTSAQAKHQKQSKLYQWICIRCRRSGIKVNDQLCV